MEIKKIEKTFDGLRLLVAIAISILFMLLVITAVSGSPMASLGTFLLGPFQSVSRIGNIIELAIPLTFTGLAICIMFEANQINCAVEGSFFLGAVIATAVSVFLPLPFGIHQIVIFLASGVIGGLICLVPAVLKVKFQANELVSSLMLNYIVLYSGLFIVNRFLVDSQAGYFASYSISRSSKLPPIVPHTRIHFGIVVAVLCVISVYLIMYRTRLGYAIRMAGKNENFARYTGISVLTVIFASQAIGGFIGGMAGSIEILGMYRRFQYTASPQYGFDGIIIATLADYKPQMIPVAALFLAYIRIGSDILSRTTDVPVEIVSVVQAIAVLFVASKLFLNKYKQWAIVKAAGIKEA